MNNNVLLAYENVKAVSGTFYGMITIVDFEMICNKHKLTKEEISILKEKLSENGISIVTIEEKGKIVLEGRSKENKGNIEEKKDKEYISIYPVSDDIVKKIAIDVMNDNNMVDVNYGAKMIKEEIRDFSNEWALTKNASYVIATVMMEICIHISLERVKKQGLKGWVCGSYTNNIKKQVIKRIGYVYSDERLSKLISYCKENKFGDEIMDALLICLVNEIRPVMVHIRGKL